MANILIVMFATAALATYEMFWKHGQGLPIFEPQSYCDVIESYWSDTKPKLSHVLTSI